MIKSINFQALEERYSMKKTSSPGATAQENLNYLALARFKRVW